MRTADAEVLALGNRALDALDVPVSGQFLVLAGTCIKGVVHGPAFSHFDSSGIRQDALEV